MLRLPAYSVPSSRAVLTAGLFTFSRIYENLVLLVLVSGVYEVSAELQCNEHIVPVAAVATVSLIPTIITVTAIIPQILQLKALWASSFNLQ